MQVEAIIKRKHALAPQIAAKNVREAGVWRSDAVYTKAQIAPEGSSVTENDFKGAACARTTIPTTRWAM